VGSLALFGCATPSRLPALPIKAAAVAHVLDIPDARFFASEDPARVRSIANKAKERRARFSPKARGFNFLAISGGGEDGAFGAGLLAGWSVLGTRPEFDVMTGISIGALSAPFAFLGPQ
jgi:hypothetical protein